MSCAGAHGEYTGGWPTRVANKTLDEQPVFSITGSTLRERSREGRASILTEREERLHHLRKPSVCSVRGSCSVR